MLSWEGFVFAAKCSKEANASTQEHIYQFNTCLLCGYIPLDCTEHPHSVKLAGTSLFVYFWMGKSVPSAQSSSGYTNHINYQEKTKDRRKQDSKWQKTQILFCLRCCLQSIWQKLKMNMKVSHLAKTLPSEDISWFSFSLHWCKLWTSKAKSQITTERFSEGKHGSNKRGKMFITCWAPFYCMGVCILLFFDTTVCQKVPTVHNTHIHIYVHHSLVSEMPCKAKNWKKLLLFNINYLF